MALVDGPREARAAGLRYSSDSEPGIARRRVGKGFAYFLPDGSRLVDKPTLRRVQQLVIPPAWTDVWICLDPNGHLLATGRDQKGRKQSLYHEDWRARRDETKFSRMGEFGKALPSIRQAVERDMRTHGLSKQKVVALVVKLLEATLIRVGNKKYAAENDSYGLTTLSTDHLDVSTNKITFHFRGKSGKFHEIEHRDKRLARLVRQCQELPGQALFQYLSESGEPQEVTSADVNSYLFEVTGSDFTAKDFRTWAATVEALRLLRTQSDGVSPTVTSVVKEVAAMLGNTPAVCRKSYIHPELVVAHKTPPKWATAAPKKRHDPLLDPMEQLAIDLLLT